MSKINLLPWREELKEQRRKQFIFISSIVAILGIATVLLCWFYFDRKLADQHAANQVVLSQNQKLDKQLKELNNLPEQREILVERMTLIQNLQAQRPITVRLLDELVRVVPEKMYLTKFTRQGDQFSVEGQAADPTIVAEFMRKLGASSWYRNVFMSSFLAPEEKTATEKSSVVPRQEERYGRFIVTADIGEIAKQAENKIAENDKDEKKTKGTQAARGKS
ncbi:MAG: PilN domain-containing protein [Acinetobacter sp.]